MLVREGDMIGGTATAQNVLLQPAPAGTGWTATTKIGIADLSNSGEQAGLVLWQSENPNNFAKVLFINKGNGTRWFEYVLTTNNGTVRLPNAGPISNIRTTSTSARSATARGRSRPSGRSTVTPGTRSAARSPSSGPT